MIRPLVRACLVIAFAGAGLALAPSVAAADASSSSGNIVVSTTVVMDVGGETLTTVRESTYDRRGNRVSYSEITNGDGVVDQTVVNTNPA